jgi:hypothetical protein
MGLNIVVLIQTKGIRQTVKSNYNNNKNNINISKRSHGMTTNRKRMLVLISTFVILCFSATTRAIPLKVDFDRDNGTSPTGWEYFKGVEIWQQGNQNVTKTFTNGTTLNIVNTSGGGQLAVEHDWSGSWNPSGDLAAMARDGLIFCVDGGAAIPGSITMNFSGLLPNQHYTLTSYHCQTQDAGYGGAAEPTTLTVGGVVAGTVTPTQPNPADAASIPQLTATFTTDGSGAYSDIVFTAPADDSTSEKKMIIFVSGIELTESSGPDEPAFRFTASQSQAKEDVSPALIDVQLLNPAEGQSYSVNYAVSGGTADSNDYTLTTPTLLTFAPGDTVKTISIDIINDGAEEADETIILQLSNPTNGAILAEPNSHTYTIINPLPQGWLAVDFERDPSGSPAGWTAVTFATGDTDNGIAFAITNETGFGGLSISYDTGWGGGYNPGGDLGKMVQDMLYVHDAGSTTIQMVFSGLDPYRPYLMTTWHNSGYPSLSAPGMIDILVGNTEVVSDFQQSHGVSNSDNAAIAEFGFPADANGMATIYFVANKTSSGGPWTADNVAINGFELLTDTSEAIFEFDVTESGGFEDETPPGIDVKLSYPPYEQTYTIDYEVIGGTAQSNDYTFTAGTLVFDPCETIASIIFDNIVDDGVDEDDETVILQLYNPSLGARLVNAEHTYTIIDIRPKFSFAIDSNSGVENVTPVLIEVNLNRDDYIKGTPRDTITVDYAATGGTADEDRYILPPGTLIFPAGVTTQYITMEVVDDIQKTQPDETVVITLSNPTGPSTLGDITEHTFTFNEDDQGVLWEGKRWYWTNENADDFKRCFVNEDGDLEWWPQQKGHIVCRIPNQRLTQNGDVAAMEYMLMTDGPHDCGGCDCDCFEESIQCVAGTSDFRVVLAEADGEYIENDQYSVGNDIFAGYKGVQFRFGPNMNASPTRWVDCTGETHKTGTINRKPESSENLAHGNDDPELRVLPGFETPPGEYSYFRVSIDSSGDAEITLNGRTYGAGGGPSMGKVDVFAVYMRNGRPYTRFVLRSLKECPGDFTGDFNVNEKDLEKLSKDWLEPDSPANLYEDGIIDGKDFAEFALYWLDECK